MKNIVYRTIVFVLTAVIAFSCKEKASEELIKNFQSVVPKPVKATLEGEVFELLPTASLYADSTRADVRQVAEQLRAMLAPATSFELPYAKSAEEAAVVFKIDPAVQGGPEAYRLQVSHKQINISAPSAAGLFFGVQTLRQIMPAAIERSEKQAMHWQIATGTIEDAPRYGWRGSMLDVARHFFSVEEVKKYIDYIAMYKMNVLHLHLSDDQGWRIEINSWPNLTVIGGSTEVGGGEGGYYTQKQYQEIVQYAADRFITVVPEIDLPGHINAALSSYEELNHNPDMKKAVVAKEVDPNKPVAGKLYTGVEVGFSTLHIKNDMTFKFVDDVLRELAAITPGPYLHIGGDEAHVTKKEDYIAFIDRFSKMVEGYGKKMIGWEEIAQGQINSNAIAQHWHSSEYASMAAQKGAQLIMSPSKLVYLDMKYDSLSKLGLNWAAYIEVDSSYLWNPATRIAGIDAKQILGVEAPLWGETIETLDDIEYLLFPRLPAIAEVGWSTQESRTWEDFKPRLGAQAPRWKTLGIDYYPSAQIPWQQ